ncbi:MAG: DUF1592 domain-containing protein [Nannocystaceae bacterium]|nr:DUF1592 domain-containing protein [Nannocystaceae bacterium]
MRGSILGNLTVAVLLSSGCYGGLTAEDNAASGGTDGVDDGDGGDGNDDGDDDGDDEAEGGVDEGSNPEELPAPNTRFYRLTHAQWENTVRDLLQLTDVTGFSVEFRPDAEESGYIYANNAQATEVDSALWAGYQRAATSTATLAIVTDPSIMDTIVTTPGDPEAFIRDFGRRAFRRSLTDAEVAVYMGAWSDAPSYYTDSVGFEAGVRLTLESMLQSPMFLYRIEASEGEAGGVIPLSDYEVASRLSYFLWDSMPDDELLDAAAADMLGEYEGVAEQAARMLDNPKAANAVEQFHYALHNVKHFESAAPNAAIYPDAPADLGLLAQEEHSRFVQDVIFEQNGSYIDLLTSNETFVNAETAALYGLDASNYGPEFEKATLDASQRRGIFTQLGFLVSNATGVQPDPIHRGVFMVKRIACGQIPAPPDNVPDLPAAEGQTNREAIVALTEQPGSDCSGCHSTVINPWGFPFENYDSTGAWRDLDNGFTVDPATNVVLGGVEVPVANALELIDVMVTSDEVHNCYADNWVQFANGRPRAAEDGPLIQRLAGLSKEDNSVKDVLIELVTSRPFRARSTQEVD